MNLNFNNENDPWEYSLDIDDSDLPLTPVLRPSISILVEPSTLTPNPVRIIPGLAGSVQQAKPSEYCPNPVRIIPGPTGIVQRAKLLKEKVFILDSDDALMSTQEYMKRVVENVGKVPETIHHKVIGEVCYGNDITVEAAMIIVNVSVYSSKPLLHYLNITKKNVVKVFVRIRFLEVEVVNALP
nr:hypothetical protein [Tanacetum cinerariifolium]